MGSGGYYRGMRAHRTSLLIAALALACRTEPQATIVVEADTTLVSGPARPVVVPEPAAAPEVQVVEEPLTAATGPSPAVDREEPAGGGLPRAGSENPEEAAADEPRTEAAEPAPPRFVPMGTRLVLALGTPLHSGTIRVGDRFAARTTEPVLVDGWTALQPGVLVEGKVADVVRAGEAGEPGRIALDFRDLVLPTGERLPLSAEIASVAGREAERPPAPSARSVAGGAVGGAVLGGAVGGRKGAVIGAVVGAVGTTLVAGARDHEVVVPSGTEIEIVLTAPLVLATP